MIQKMKNKLNEKGYIYESYGDYGVTINFSQYVVFINETLSEKLHVRVENLKGKKIDGKVYKTTSGVINFILKTC